MDTTQATATNRLTFWVNGVQITAFSTQTTIPQNNTHQIALGGGQYTGVGSDYAGTTNFDGYLAEFIFIDGTPMTAADFGQFDTNGNWQPKSYAGSYGTNGFKLNFSDNSSVANLGLDSSGNGNTFNLVTASVTAGITNDSLIDSPTNYGTDTGLGNEVHGNYCTLSANDKATDHGTVSEANSRFECVFVDNSAAVRGTFGTSTGKWGFEVTNYSAAGSGNSWYGCWTADANRLNGVDNFVGNLTRTIGFHANFGGAINKFSDSASSTAVTGASWAVNDTLQVLIDFDAGKAWIGKGGNYYNASNTLGAFDVNSPTITWTPNGLYYVPIFTTTASSDNVNRSGLRVNFGQRPFINGLPFGFQCLCTQNLPNPAIAKPSQYFNAKLYTGNHAANAITGVGHQPDLVWAKNRPNAFNNIWNDSVRGAQNYLTSETQNAETNVTTSVNFTSFDPDGFTVGASSSTDMLNNLGTANNQIAWCWKKGAVPGFDIVTYTGNATNRTVPHGLGVAPAMMIVKSRSAGALDWVVYHRNMNASPATGYMLLNGTGAFAAAAIVWNSTAPTASVFSLGTGGSTNPNAVTLVNWLFAEVPGFSRIAWYGGNGSADGPFANCGFRPRFVMIKRADAATNWIIHDAARSAINPAPENTFANLNNAEATASSSIDFCSNGFKIRTTGGEVNTNGGIYIYAAFAENPFKTARAR